MKKLTEEKIPEITVKVKRGKFAKSKKIDLPEQTISETASKIDVVFDKSVEEIIDKTQDQKTEKPKSDNSVLWLLAGLALLALIAYLHNMYKKNEETN
jgi:hypothetical protein